MVEHKHFFKDFPYSYGSGSGWFYQTGEKDKDGRVAFYNDKTCELQWMYLELDGDGRA